MTQKMLIFLNFFQVLASIYSFSSHFIVLKIFPIRATRLYICGNKAIDGILWWVLNYTMDFLHQQTSLWELQFEFDKISKTKWNSGSKRRRHFLSNFLWRFLLNVDFLLAFCSLDARRKTSLLSLLFFYVFFGVWAVDGLRFFVR